MRYQVEFTLNHTGYDYETSTRDEALFLYNLIKNTYPDCREIGVWDYNESKYICWTAYV